MARGEAATAAGTIGEYWGFVIGEAVWRLRWLRRACGGDDGQQNSGSFGGRGEAHSRA